MRVRAGPRCGWRVRVGAAVGAKGEGGRSVRGRDGAAEAEGQVCKTRTFALGNKPHSFFAPEGKPPRRGLNPRPLTCGNNLPKRRPWGGVGGGAEGQGRGATGGQSRVRVEGATGWRGRGGGLGSGQGKRGHGVAGKGRSVVGVAGQGQRVVMGRGRGPQGGLRVRVGVAVGAKGAGSRDSKAQGGGTVRHRVAGKGRRVRVEAG
nr:hypothetical protein [Tanacetum cinerariifolium]